MTRILVESDLDAQIVRGLLRKLNLAVEIPVTALKRSLNPENKKSRDAILREQNLNPGKYLILYDQESGNIADEPEYYPDEYEAHEPGYIDEHEDEEDRFEFLGTYTRWCPAIPVVEAWLFADETALYNTVPDSAIDVLKRLPTPESIPYPKMVRHYLLRRPEQISEVLASYDLSVASARSPSLANFLRSIQQAEGVEKTFDSIKIASRQIDRDIVRGLISEVFPSSSTIFRTSDGEMISAEQMMREVANGSEIGREYATAILRVARDFLARQARREKQFHSK